MGSASPVPQAVRAILLRGAVSASGLFKPTSKTAASPAHLCVAHSPFCALWSRDLT